MKEFFGIDFGTTNSATVGLLQGHTTLFGDDAGQPYPSIIAVNETTGQVVAKGREAWNGRQELSRSCRILTSAKLHIGEKDSERIGPETWSPERVVMEVLKGLAERVRERGNGALLEKATMAIPVGFPPEKRKALRKAAQGAGIEIEGFISEPTAAIVQNYDRVQKWRKVVVFDWGGGTLDISIVELADDAVHEIGTLSRNIGGDNLDLSIAEWAHSQILAEAGENGPPFAGMDSRFRDIMIARAEAAKRTLSDEDETSLNINNYGTFGARRISLNFAEFTSMMSPFIKEALDALEECIMTRAALSPDQIDCIIMVGGSSKLRGLRDAIYERNWPFDPILPEDSDWNVAQGAAVLAANFGLYTSSQDLGVLLSDETTYPILQDGDIIDHTPERMGFHLVEETDHARFVFVEGRRASDGSLTDSNRAVGYLSVPTYGFVNEEIEVESFVDRDFLLQIHARSVRHADSQRKTWTYPELRFSYHLPERP